MVEAKRKPARHFSGRSFGLENGLFFFLQVETFFIVVLFFT